MYATYTLTNKLSFETNSKVK